MLSIRCRWLLMGVFFDIFLSPLCSPFVAGGYYSTTQNFSKCRKSRFSQSLLFHSIPFSYVVNRIFSCTLLWEVFGQPLHHIFRIFLSPMYSIRCRWLIFFFKNFSKSPYALHSLQVAITTGKSKKHGAID